MRYALYEYKTENIGDEIQSIAARRFLPRVDEYVNRDEIGMWSPKEPTKIIMNGWYMHSPYAWPPSSSFIDPLLISMYVDQKDPKVGESFFSEESRQYCQAHGAIGARDLSTRDYLLSQGIDSFFSGCMTLTLQRDPDIEKQDYILAVDVPDSIVNLIKKHTNRPVIVSSPYYDAELQRDDRFQLAEYFLYLYQSAHAVVTTRLHAMLPSLALETPVLLIKDSYKYESARYAGLDNLVYSLTEDEYLADFSKYNINEPPENKQEYIAIRNELIERVSSFTGYNNTKSFRTVDFSKIACNEAYIRLFTSGFHALNRAALLYGDKLWLQEEKRDLQNIVNELRSDNSHLQSNLEQLRGTVDRLNQNIQSIYSSKTWRIGKTIIAPAVWIKNFLRGRD